jgi:hypothetical protein
MHLYRFRQTTIALSWIWRKPRPQDHSVSGGVAGGHTQLERVGGEGAACLRHQQHAAQILPSHHTSHNTQKRPAREHNQFLSNNKDIYFNSALT